MMPAEYLGAGAAGAFGIAAVGAWFLRVFLRRSVKDLTDTKSDLSQLDYLKALAEDNRALRDGIDKIAKERNEAVSQVGSLRVQIEALETTVAALRSELVNMQRSLDGQRELIERLARNRAVA